MSKRKSKKYLNKSTNDYLILSVILFLLCIWAIKDAWFPSPKVLKKHPHEIPITFSSEGYIQKILVNEGEFINDDTTVATIDNNNQEAIFKWKKGGIVQSIYKNKYDFVNTDDVVVLIKPKDTFYSFNQTLAVFSGIGSLTFLLIHIKS